LLPPLWPPPVFHPRPGESPRTVVDRVDYEVCTKDGWTVRMNVAIGGALDRKPLKDIFGDVLKEIARDSTAAEFTIPVAAFSTACSINMRS
jgi:hypothetical protein